MGDIDEVKKSPSASESGEQPSKEADTIKNKREYKPSILKFKIQSLAALSPCEWLFIISSLLPAAAAVLLIVMFTEEKLDSAKYLFPIVLSITTVFLLVYPAHGVLMRMPYSLVLHCVCIVVVVAFCIVYYKLPNDNREIKITILVLCVASVAVEVFFVPYMFRKYWKAREITFPFGADGDYQDEIVKHLVAMCLLLLNLHSELTFVAFILKIKMTAGEIIDVVAGVLVSVCMCVCGFLFLYKKWKRLVFGTPLLIVAEVVYMLYNLVATLLNPKDLSDVLLVFIILTVASIAVLILMLTSLFFICKQSWRKNDDEKSNLL